MKTATRSSLIVSLLYSAGLFLYIAFPDPHTPLVFKIPALLAIFSLISVPTFVFYAKLSKTNTQQNRFGSRLLFIVSLLFLVLWIAWTPLIISAIHSDALGGLSFFIVTISQTALLIISAIIIYVSKRNDL
jgi:hypothetical protein